eukprot:403372882
MNKQTTQGRGQSQAKLSATKNASRGPQNTINKRSTGMSQGPTTSRDRRNAKLKEQQKLEEEAKKAMNPEKKRILLDRSVANINTLSYNQVQDTDRLEIKNAADSDLKSPLKRDYSNNVLSLKPRIEQEDFEERQRTLQKVESQKQRRLEWRAQFQELEETVEQEKIKIREKSEQKRIKGDLIRIVHTEESENQIAPRLKESFWERIGFKNKEKEEQNLNEGKEKIDTIYKKLRDTVKHNHQMRNDLEEKRQKIKNQAQKKLELQAELQKQKQLMIEVDESIKEAQEDLDEVKIQNQSRITKKQNHLTQSIEEKRLSHIKVYQDYESAQMRLEDQQSKYWRVKVQQDKEMVKNQSYIKFKDESMLIQEEENQIDGQLAMSKPLVTEIMEYFNAKENESQDDERVEEWVEALQFAIEECLNAEQKFQKAAYYDAQKFLPFERTQRSAYTDKIKFNQ